MRWSLVLLPLVLLAACSGGGSSLPWPEDTLDSLAVRTDFTDDAAFETVRTASTAPYGEFQAHLVVVDDPRWDGLTVDRLVELAAADETIHDFAFLIDHAAITDPEHAVLVVELEPGGRSFRVAPKAMWDVQVNLAIANVGWEEYLESMDDDGVYRGYF